MKEQLIYKDLARYYDLVYSKKDYKKEAQEIRKLIETYKKSTGKELLEVACGTGKHLAHLKNNFECTVVDINPEMLRVAKKNVSGVSLKRADMVRLNLRKQYDIVLCLFSSIGYVKTYANLRKTIRNFAAHLKKGGIAIIEPWLDSKGYFVGLPHMTTYDANDVKIARLVVSQRKGLSSIMDMHYLIAEKNRKVRHLIDTHIMGLFDRKKIVDIMESSGLRTRYLKHGFTKGRGLFVAVKK